MASRITTQSLTGRWFSVTSEEAKGKCCSLKIYGPKLSVGCGVNSRVRGVIAVFINASN
jgi:hypothetical protein